MVRDLPPEDILAHGLYLTGFPPPPSSSAAATGDENDAKEREAFTAPWTAVGGLVTWLSPGKEAVVMFYSIATANRALRQVQPPRAGIKAESLKRAAPEVKERALAGKDIRRAIKRRRSEGHILTLTLPFFIS